MPKSRHRAPVASSRQWVVWAVAGFLVAAAVASLSSLGNGPASVAWTFLLLLLCFVTGSLANSMFLSQPLRRGGHIVLPAVPEPEAIEQAPVEPERMRPRPELLTGRPRAARAEAVLPTFASEIDAGLDVTVLISGNTRSDPADSEVYVVDSIPVQKTSADVVEIAPENVARKPESGPYPGAVRARSNGQSPDSGYRVKGNTRSKRYHTMQSPYYERTKASVWFRSAADAERAGFSAWNSRVKNAI